MKARAWIVTALVVGGVGYTVKGGCLNGGSKAPDEKLAASFVDLCEIARDHVEKPEQGVKKLGRYFVKHADDMLGAFGSTLATIEKIPDDTKHDARARLARERIQAPLRACERDWERFFDAVEADPDALELLQRGIDRFGRTLEIIFSTQGEPLRLRELPRRLESLL